MLKFGKAATSRTLVLGQDHVRISLSPEVAMEAMTLVESPSAEAVQASWNPLARIAFRFCFVYFSLYCLAAQVINSVFPIPKVDVPDWDTLLPVRSLVFWVAAHVFRLKTPLVYSGSGSGDKQFDWVMMFCLFVISLLATAVWSLLDRRRQNYARLHKWFWLFLLLCLASQMFVYGMVKAIPLQMPYPNLSRLMERFGDFSPMGVLWYSVGASPRYETFAGCAELLGGLLLIFRRTRTLGLLICVADLTQVFVLNMTYDVPVKQFSFHLVLIALLLLAPERKRLMGFLLNQPTEPWMPPALFAGRRAQRIATGVLTFIWLWMLGNGVYGLWDGWHQYGTGAPKSALYGIWNIQDYTLDGKPQPLAVTDAQAWRRMIFDYPQYTQIQCMDDLHGYGSAIDQKAGTVTLNDQRDKNWQARFAFTRPAPDQLTLDGTIAGKKAVLHLKRLDEKKLLLESRGFHWVQDYPLNR
jgi:hypothetical protein